MRSLSKSQSKKVKVTLLLLCVVIVSQGCGRFRILNRDNSVLGSHPVTITPCGWKLEDKLAGEVKDEPGGKAYYKYACGETVLTIKDELLVVNGKSYGKLAKATDSIKVDSGKVLVNGQEVQAVVNTAVAESGR